VTGHVIGQTLADAVFGCLAALPAGQAESAGSIWIAPVGHARFRRRDCRRQGVPGHHHRSRRHWRQARQGRVRDHRLPSGIGTIPVEVTEAQSALVPAQGIPPGPGRRRRFAVVCRR
jgi:hypothetical protein